MAHGVGSEGRGVSVPKGKKGKWILVAVFSIESYGEGNNNIDVPLSILSYNTHHNLWDRWYYNHFANQETFWGIRWLVY